VNRSRQRSPNLSASDHILAGLLALFGASNSSAPFRNRTEAFDTARYLNVQLCHNFFGRNKSFIKLWKTKKFQDFNYHVLEGLFLLEKLRYVKSFKKIPKKIAKNIDQINVLRNGLAHAFFPENLKRSKPIYKGKSIFTFEGIQQFVDDMSEISHFFIGV
jgi:hypothetical protein